MKMDSRTLAGFAMLASTTVVLDYTLKYSGLKIPFPWLPLLKFDFTGIPIVLSFIVFGFASCVFTTIVAFAAIFIRSGDLISSFMKAIAELSTIVGMMIAIRIVRKSQRVVPMIFGILLRYLVMAVLNLIVLPKYYGMPFSIALGISPMIIVFNVIQGSISVIGALVIFKAIRKRISSPKDNELTWHHT